MQFLICGLYISFKQHFNAYFQPILQVMYPVTYWRLFDIELSYAVAQKFEMTEFIARKNYNTLLFLNTSLDFSSPLKVVICGI